METTERPNIKHKSFFYTTMTEWATGKSGTLSSDGKPTMRIASPPEFKGEPDVWTPEDMFVAAIESCQMMTFLALAGRAHLPLIAYQSTARGSLDFVDGSYRFTRVVVTPVITVARTVSEAEVHAVVRDAHMHCLVANSVNSILEVNATVVLQ